MKERPILFSSPMIRAILAGTKTQTRRVVTHKHGTGDWASVHKDGSGLGWIAWAPSPCTAEETVRRYPGQAGFLCPYGVPGDRLWVRETLEINSIGADYAADGELALEIIASETTDEQFEWWNRHASARPEASATVPSIFMPRWASRITLEVTEVRVQRVQEITEEDAKAEGAGSHPGSFPLVDRRASLYVHAFADLWNAINAKRGYSWDSNPFVWAVSFERIQS